MDFELIKQYGISTAIVMGMFTVFLFPLFKIILKSFNNTVNRENLNNDNNCSKKQLYSLAQLYFNNINLKLYRFIVNTRSNTELIKDKVLLNTMIKNNFEKILQENNIFIKEFKFNAVNVDVVLNAVIVKPQIITFITITIENPNISNSDIQCLVDNIFITNINDNF